MRTRANKKLTYMWQNLIKKYRKNPIDFNFKHAVRASLDERRSDSLTHYIHSYPGKMFPYIPLFFFSIAKLCLPDGIVLDPFCGSGTVLLESIIHPIYRRHIYGVEINPLGRLIAEVKTTPLEEGILRERINHLFDTANKSRDAELCPTESEILTFWFSKTAICELSRLKHLIEEEGVDDEYKDFFRSCFSSIIRKVSLADPFIPPPVRLRLSKYENSPQKYRLLSRFLKQTENPDAISLFKSVIAKNFRRIKRLNNKIRQYPKEVARAQIVWDDARNIKLGKTGTKGKLNRHGAGVMPSNSIDLVLTSPPYLTAQKYIRTQRLELLWLGMLSERQLRELDKQVIGTERVYLSEIDFTQRMGIDSVDNLIKWASALSRRRAAELFKFFFGMKEAIQEMHRVLRNGAYAIVVIGNNGVLGRKVETYKLLIEIAVHLGFRLELVLKDEIRGRGMITRRHDSGGLIKEEFIAVLRKE